MSPDDDELRACGAEDAVDKGRRLDQERSDRLDRLKAQMEQSRRLWDIAVDTADDRESVAKEAADAAMDAWHTALASVEDSEIDAAREALEEARVLADEWGDDSTERSAIKMLDVEDDDGDA